ncbi:cyanophycinase [Geothrix sp. PMB-07]|uniref:cyanophycinase n=1 Tax=Geothrix sp. PMB-07 TaxID=3068640 RepID=UPI0027414C9F|nr:cyanophycinase [Geothrix sp. PMB-07]WLT30835.1 cyanophycinase [Geothrix sp. PMB-07]
MQRLLVGVALLFTSMFAASQIPPKGTLVIVGGGGFPADVQAAFFQACGGRGGVVGIIPTSTSDPEGALKEWKADLDQVGMVCVPLDVRRREDASNPELLKAAARCTGFWFSGGDQNLVGDKIVGTPLQKLILDRYAAGAGVGGTSAGAAIMSKVMLTGDDRHGKEALSEFGPGAYQTREGMGFLPAGVVIDQHFLRRGRENRLFSVLMERPDHLGLGIDEATALVVKDGRATVVGQRSVMVFDPAGMALKGETFRDLRIHLLKTGQSIDLATRKISQP